MHESCHAHKRAMSHTCMSHATHTVAADSEAQSVKLSHITHMHESWHTHAWVMSHTGMRHVTHTNEWSYTHECVILHTYDPTISRLLKNHRSLLQKSPIKESYFTRMTLRGKECSRYPRSYELIRILYIQTRLDIWSTTHIDTDSEAESVQNTQSVLMCGYSHMLYL